MFHFKRTYEYSGNIEYLDAIVEEIKKKYKVSDFIYGINYCQFSARMNFNGLSKILRKVNIDGCYSIKQIKIKK